MSDKGGLSSKAQESLGMIPGSAFYSPFPFSGMNVESSGIALDDKEFRLLENFFRVGDGKIRTAWDIGAPLYTASAGKIIIHFYAYNIGPTNYFAIFLNDGTGYQVNAASGAVTTISSAPNLFYLSSSGFVPATGQWGTLYLLISNRNTPNDYWIWDGTTLYQSGTLAPGLIEILATGTNYATAPTVTAFGGSGSGATFTATVNAGGVVQIQIVNPGTGYEVGDIPQLAFSGGGSDSSAILMAALNDGSVTAVNITAPGSGYTSATVAFSGGGGTGAAGTVQIGSGVTAVTVTAPGTGYTGATVTFSGGGGTGAAAIASVVGGQVVSITVTSPGSGYTSNPTVAIAGDGTGATATATHQNGIVTGVLMTNPGTGYTTAPSVAISGTGTGATGVAIISSSGVAGVTVVNGGSGFTFAPLIAFEGGGGSGATGTVILTGTSIARVNVVNGGANYQAAPAITFTGGGGTGATAVPVLAGGQVIAINVTNGGSGYTTNPEVIITPAKNDTGSGATAVAIFSPTSIASVQMMNYGSGYTSAPTVVVTPGANNAAYANIILMPFGVSGNSIETFQSRVWIANPADSPFNNLPQGGNFAVSAPGSLTDFATSDGGLLFSNTDAFLQTKYVAIRQSNGYLYFFGDGSASVVSNVQTSGSPATTTFNYQNVDPQIGMSWRDSRQDFSRTILFGNETGVYGLYGGACTKVSGKLDDIFVNAVFPPTAGALTPTSAVMTVFDVKHYFMLMTLQDPDTLDIRNAMICWNEKEWGLASQGANLTIIGSQKIASKLYAWGTDGTALYPLFNTPSAILEKRLDTKLYGASSAYMIKDLTGIYVQAQDKSSALSGVALNVELVTGGIAAQNPESISVPSLAEFNGFLQPPNFLPGTATTYFPCMASGTGGIPFVTMGINLTTKSPDFVLGNIMLMYNNLSAFVG